MCLYLKCNVKWDTLNKKFKIINQHKNNMCQVWWSLWKKTFNHVLLTMFSPLSKKGQVFNQI
jgi:hypothetical protein